jgi:hypothetical protein
LSISPGYSDEQILEAIRHGNDGPVEFLYNKGYKMSYKILKGLGIEHADISEIYQESFSIFLVWVQAKSFRLRVQLTTILVEICKRQGLKFKKQSGKYSEISSLPEDELENVSYEMTENVGYEIKEVIAFEEFEKMKVKKGVCYKIIWLSLIEGKKNSDIAQLLGKSDDVLKSQKSECLKYLKVAIFKRVPKWMNGKL